VSLRERYAFPCFSGRGQMALGEKGVYVTEVNANFCGVDYYLQGTNAIFLDSEMRKH
jgi:hypothetical protein